MGLGSSVAGAAGKLGTTGAEVAGTAAAGASSTASAVAGNATFNSLMGTYSATEQQAMAKNIQFMIAQANFSPSQKVSKADASS